MMPKRIWVWRGIGLWVEGFWSVTDRGEIGQERYISIDEHERLLAEAVGIKRRMDAVGVAFDDRELTEAEKDYGLKLEEESKR